MENSKKNLRLISVISLVFAVCSLTLSIVTTVKALSNIENIPEGFTEGIVIASAVALCAVSLILFLPQLYVGIKGIRVSKNPDSSKGHIIWATILVVFSVIAIFSPISDMIKTSDITGNLSGLIEKAVNIVIYCAYIKFAKQLLKTA